MSPRDSRRLLAKELTAAAATYQVAVVIPHCAKCAKPCCRLDPLVLELNWKQLKTLWQIEESRTASDGGYPRVKAPRKSGRGMGSTTPIAKSARPATKWAARAESTVRN